MAVESRSPSVLGFFSLLGSKAILSYEGFRAHIGTAFKA